MYIAALATALMTACTNTVVPPAEPARPVAAFLLDHGRHASLVLERADDGMTRYAWGDWDYYALNRTGPFRASGTLFGANRAGLGRKRLPGPSERAHVRHHVAVPIEAMWRIDVPADRARLLHERLDRRFLAERRTLTANPLYDLEFVHDPKPYDVTSNSNHQVGDWLRELGCEVRMAGPFSNWRVTAPAERPTGSPVR